MAAKPLHACLKGSFGHLVTVAVDGLLKLGRFLLFVVTALVVVACVAVFGSRLTVNESLRTTIEAVASENAGLATSSQPTGSGFGLGGGQAAPSEADLAEIQKLFGKS